MDHPAQTAPRTPAADPPVPLPVLWRPAGIRAVLLAAAALVLVVIAVIAIAAPAAGGAPWSPADRLLLGVCGVLFSGGLWMLARPRVAADADGLTVVNLMRVHRLSWPQVLRVNLRQGDPWATLDLADGTSIAAMGIQPAGGRDRAVAAARQLRDLIAHRAEAPEPRPEG